MAFGVKLDRESSFMTPIVLGGASAALVFAVMTTLVLDPSKFGGPGQQQPAQVFEAKRSEPVKKVIVPTSDIAPGTQLSREMFRVEERRLSELPFDVLTSYEDVEKAYANTFISARLPIVPANIVFAKTASLLTQRIPKGFRAVTIMVDMRSAVEGWVLPGARVDVVWTTVVDDQRTLRVIVENAEVLSAERMATVNNNPKDVPLGMAPIVTPTTVTLLTSAEDAQKVHFASTNGVLGLSLRGTTDESHASNGGSLTLDEMLGIKSNDERIEGQVVFRDSSGRRMQKMIVKGALVQPAS